MIVRELTAYFLRTARQIAQNAAHGALVATVESIYSPLVFDHLPSKSGGVFLQTKKNGRCVK